MSTITPSVQNFQYPRYAFWKNERLVLNITLQPNAKKEHPPQVIDQRLKIWIRERPIAGQANEALQAILSKNCHILKRNCILVKGEKSKKKVMIISCSEQEAIECLRSLEKILKK